MVIYLSSIAIELIEHICYHILTDAGELASVRTWLSGETSVSRSDAHALAQLCLVSRHWNLAATRVLYECLWVNDEVGADSERLRRTLIRYPTVAPLVHRIEVCTSYRITREVLDHISITQACPNLQHLRVRGYNMQDLVYYKSSLSALTRLESLFLSFDGRNATGSGLSMCKFPEVFWLVRNMKSLRHLSLEDVFSRPLVPSPQEGHHSDVLPVLNLQSFSVTMVLDHSSIDILARCCPYLEEISAKSSVLIFTKVLHIWRNTLRCLRLNICRPDETTDDEDTSMTMPKLEAQRRALANALRRSDLRELHIKDRLPLEFLSALPSSIESISSPVLSPTYMYTLNTALQVTTYASALRSIRFYGRDGWPFGETYMDVLERACKKRACTLEVL